MIILGNRYNFLQSEIIKLRKKHGRIYHIALQNKDEEAILNEINNIINTKKVNFIVINAKINLQNKLINLLTKYELQGIKIVTIEHFLEKFLHKCYIDEKSIDYLENIKSYNKIQYLQKRLIDYITIIILFPITLVFAVITYFKIKKQSPGPLLFKQKRVGIYEKEFTCIKFRSMHPNAEVNGAQFAKENDPRTYPWGKFIRDTKIDELAQLWNVFKGDMHFVGPRPERKIWIEEFEKEIPYYSKRHLVRPGITGLAQIKYQYGSGKLDAYQKLMYDLYYIKNWSIALELKIILDTIIFVLSKKRKKIINTSKEFIVSSQKKKK